jgi:hypothetical protein
MPSWLNEIASVLDRAESPVRIFFRDDDAGWANDKLFNLLDKFAKAEMPIDLAVIPQSLECNLAEELRTRWQQNCHLLGLHQHGYSHTNHELSGRKCEFGVSRTKSQQMADIANGQALLKESLAEAFDPFFTPPWNRCTQDTIECLEGLEFKLLSRDITATKYSSTKLEHVPVHIDWSKFIKNSADPLTELSHAIANHLVQTEFTGVMFHHADMEDKHLKTLTELLALLSGHQNVQGLLLRDTLG